ncbi:MAG: tryptophan-rich sensory protein [Clostridia bacterium]|nr:tryptophan-rich sensory protein [Clostridia bacterium]
MKFKIWKQRLKASFCRLHLRAICICAGIALLLGVLIAVSGGGRYPVFYCLPKGALPTFFVLLFWGLCFALLGASLGAFLFSHGCTRERTQILLLFVFALTLSYAWIPIVYKAGSLFFGLLISLLLLGTVCLLFISLCKYEFLFAVSLLPCGFWAFYISYYTFALLLLNG